MSLSPRDRTILGVVVLVVAVAAAWLLVIQPKRSELSKLQHQVSSAQSQLATAQQSLVAGQSARSQFGASYASMVRLGEAVPTDDNVGSLIYQLQSAANGTGVDFRSLSLAPSSGSSAPPPSSSAGSSQSGQNSLPPGVTVGSAGFPVEPFSFSFRGSFFHLADFFARLQRFVTPTQRGVLVRGRLLSLNSINLGPGTGGFPQIDATVSATAYLLPASQGLTAGATPLGPGASPAPTPSTPAPSTTTPVASPAPAPPTGGSSGNSVPPAAAVTGGQS